MKLKTSTPGGVQAAWTEGSQLTWHDCCSAPSSGVSPCNCTVQRHVLCMTYYSTSLSSKKEDLNALSSIISNIFTKHLVTQ
jgi:hypothetical protein